MLKNKKNMGAFSEFCERMQRKPCAVARIEGSCEYPEIRGCVWFYTTQMGVMVAAEIYGLPEETERCQSPFFGFHIHEGRCCTGTSENPFANAGGHYNPDCCPHPEHAGDMPPLLANHGYALQVFLVSKYCVDDIIGRTVIIHANPDDFTSQPSGNSGEIIACGEIKRCLCSK